MSQQQAPIVREEIVLPDLPIIDSHIHLWNRTGVDYFSPEFLADAMDGHDVRQSIYVECNMGYDPALPEEYKPVSETRYVLNQIELIKDAPVQITGILGAADLLMGRDIKPILEAHQEAAQGRFRGVRFRVAFDDDPEAGYHEIGYQNEEVITRPELLEAAKLMADMGLVLDLWGFHTQLEDVKAFARKVPNLQIVLDHVGGPLGVGRYATMREEVFATWSKSIHSLSEAENVTVKLSGLGISRLGFKFEGGAATTTSDQLVAAWGRYVRTCVEAFGPERNVFGSNFPVDRQAASYRTLLNGFKKMLGDLDRDKLQAIFHDNAKRLYRLP